MSDVKVPFNRPFIAGREWQYLRESVDAGHISGDGLFPRRCERLLEEVVPIKTG